MKFGRYLEENLTPEWRRAYIDYKGCKKRIKVVEARLRNRQVLVGGGEPGGINGGIKLARSRSRARRGSTSQPQGGTTTADGGVAGENDDDDDDAGDSSDNDLDHGPSAPPSNRSRRTPSIRAAGAGSGSRGTPSTPRARDWPGRSPSTVTSTQNYGSTTISPRPPTDRYTGNPPPLDIGEPSAPQVRARGHTVAFASELDGPMSGISKSPEDMGIEEVDEGEGPRARTQSGESDASKISRGDDPATPLTGAGTDPSPRFPNGADPKGMRSPRFVGALITKATGSSPKTGPSSPWTAGGSRSILHPLSRLWRSMLSGTEETGSMTLPSPFLPARTAATFSELYETLEPDERDFFDFLDAEIEKVESFYLARQGDAAKRLSQLRSQLRELAEHRRLYHEVMPGSLPQWESTMERYIPGLATGAAHATVTSVANVAQRLQQRVPHVGVGVGVGGAAGAGSKDVEAGAKIGHGGVNGGLRVHTEPGTGMGAGQVPQPRAKTPNGALDAAAKAGRDSRDAAKAERDKQYSAERYTKYKHELKKAVLEFYRQLEIIKNYRILNVTGFRKALKKFEKTTRIHCLESFTDEHITSQAFAKGDINDRMIREVEDMFSEHFEHGDAKKARDKLRRQDQVKTHYSSVFRSGTMIGVGLTLTIVSLVRASEEAILDDIPTRDGLLQVYAGLYLPVIFALLFELNLAAFVAARINYEFVMELSRPALDYRSFLEIPSFLFLTLSICMFFSYFLIGVEQVAPTTWPAGWLVFVIIFFLNPLPIMRRRTRYWFLRVLWRVVTPGWSRVEFIAFFVADELNSLVYSIQNILFFSCAYANRWPADLYGTCPSGAQWPYILVLSAPAIVRLIQCLKRYFDSDLKIHLINAGKYSASVLQYAMFVWWRIRGSRIPDGVFVGWMIAGIISATYNCTWDFMVDWSLLRSGSRGLRKDRGYSSRYVYYFAMATNVLIRFIFVWYVPARASHVRVRSFFFAVLEMLRRWQWNFFRVETEHLGNADAYRVTREIPLPYRQIQPDSDEEAEISTKTSPVKAKWAKLKKAVLSKYHSASPEELIDQHAAQMNGSPATIGTVRTRVTSRAYEARHPGEMLQRRQTLEDEADRDRLRDPEQRGWDGLLKRLRERGKVKGDHDKGEAGAADSSQTGDNQV